MSSDLPPMVAGGSATSAAATEAVARQRTATLRRSCEACRTVKAKCVVEPHESGLRCCRRCTSHGIKCVFENALARPKKLKYTARTRVRDVEEKLDGLIALLSARNEAAAAAAEANAAVAAEQTPLPSVPVPPSLSLPSTSISAPAILPFASAFEMPHPLRNSASAFSTAAEIDFSLGSSPFFSTSAAALAPAAAAPITTAPVPIRTPPMTTPASRSHVLAPAPASFLSSSLDVVARGLLGEDQAHLLLAEYVDHAEQHFPYVLLPAYVTLAYMRRERPFLLLAILTATARAPLQSRLALEFRKALAQGMIVESRGSLDMLQGLMVFCVWQHHYFKPFSSQLYQLSQIAVTLAVELDLPNVFAQTRLPYYFTSVLPSASGYFSPKYTGPGAASVPLSASASAAASGGGASATAAPTEQYLQDIERCRTMIGCYCLSASVALAHHKPTHFQYDRTMERLCQILESAREAPSDALILPFQVRLCQMTEEIHRVFDRPGFSGGGGGSDAMDGQYIEMMVKDFERQYEQLKSEIPIEGWSNASLRCAVTFLPVSLYEIGLRVPQSHRVWEYAEASTTPPTSSSSSPAWHAQPPPPCCEWCTSRARLTLLAKLIRASQAYIEAYLDLPLTTLQHVTISEVSRHVDSVLMLSRAGLGMDTRRYRWSRLAAERADLVGLANVGHYIRISQKKMGAIWEKRGGCGGEAAASSHAAPAPPLPSSAHDSAHAQLREGGHGDANKTDNAFAQMHRIFAAGLVWYRQHVEGRADAMDRLDAMMTPPGKLNKSSLSWLSVGTDFAGGSRQVTEDAAAAAATAGCAHEVDEMLQGLAGAGASSVHVACVATMSGPEAERCPVLEVLDGMKTRFGTKRPRDDEPKREPDLEPECVESDVSSAEPLSCIITPPSVEGPPTTTTAATKETPDDTPGDLADTTVDGFGFLPSSWTPDALPDFWTQNSPWFDM